VKTNFENNIGWKKPNLIKMSTNCHSSFTAADLKHTYLSSL